MQAVFAENTRAHELANAQVGPSHIDIPSMVEPGETIAAVSWSDVERAVPKEQHPDLNARYNRSLEEQPNVHYAIVGSLIGDEDEAVAAVADPELVALRAFTETVPTTLPGLLAMIVFAGRNWEHEPEIFADSSCPLIENLATAAKALQTPAHARSQ